MYSKYRDEEAMVGIDIVTYDRTLLMPQPMLDSL